MATRVEKLTANLEKAKEKRDAARFKKITELMTIAQKIIENESWAAKTADKATTVRNEIGKVLEILLFTKPLTDIKES